MASGAADQLENKLQTHHNPANGKDGVTNPHYSSLTSSFLNPFPSNLAPFNPVGLVGSNSLCPPSIHSSALTPSHRSTPSTLSPSSIPICIPGTSNNTSLCQSSNIFQPVSPFGTPSTSSLSVAFTPTSATSLSSSLTLGYTLQHNDSQTCPLSLGTSLQSNNSFLNGSKPKVKKCSIDGCSERVAKIIGDCKYCDKKYCSVHRLPEEHECNNIGDLKKNSFDKYSTKLLSEKCVADKI